jgi:hypothetical protein
MALNGFGFDSIVTLSEFSSLIIASTLFFVFSLSSESDRVKLILFFEPERFDTMFLYELFFDALPGKVSFSPAGLSNISWWRVGLIEKTTLPD